MLKLYDFGVHYTDEQVKLITNEQVKLISFIWEGVDFTLLILDVGLPLTYLKTSVTTHARPIY